jgi:hypothetical protein
MKEAPRLAEAVVRLAALDLTHEEIAFALGMSVNTVSRITVATATAVEGYKERLAANWREVTHLTMGRIREILRNPTSEVTLKELSILAGIGTEKEQLLTGGATQRVEVVEEPPVEAFKRYIDSLPRIGLGSETLGAKGAGPAGRSPGETGSEGAAAEGESDVSMGSNEGSEPRDTGSDTEGGLP